MTWLTIDGLKRRDAPAPRKLFAGEILAFSRPSSRMYCTSSTSESGSGRSTRSSLSASGRCLKRPSMLSSSSALSISARSLSAFGRYVTRKSLVRLAFDECVVGLLVEELGIVLHGAELDDPALAVGILVDVLGMIFELRVGLRHLATNGTVQIGGRLHRFDHSEPRARIELLTNRRQFEVDHVTELRLGILADPHGRRLSILLDPLVGLREAHAAQVCHPNSLSFISDEAACKRAAERPRPARPCRERPRQGGSPVRTWPAARRPSRCCSQG